MANCPNCKTEMKDDICSNCGYKIEDEAAQIDADINSEEKEESAQYEDVFSDSPIEMVKVDSEEDSYNEIDENNNVIEGQSEESGQEGGFVDPSEIIRQNMPKSTDGKSSDKIKKILVIAVAAIVVIAILTGLFLLIGNLFKGSLPYSVSSDSAVYIGKTVFFANPADSNKLYKIESPDGEAIKLFDESVKYLTTDGNKIYFSLNYNDDILCSIMPDGSNVQKELTEHSARYNAYYGKHLYYSNPYEDNQIYRLSSNGKVEQIDNAKGTNILVTSRYIYFMDDGTLACVSLKDGERTDFIDGVSWISTDGSDLAFVSNGVVSYYENAKSDLNEMGYSTNIVNAQDVTIIKNGKEFSYLDADGFIKQMNIASDETKDITSSGGYDFYYYLRNKKSFVAIDYDDMKVTYIDHSGHETEIPLEKINPYRNSYAAAGNAMNGAYGATDDQNLYFLNYAQSCIEKVELGDDFDNAKVLVGVPASFITCSDGYIYYCDYDMGGLLYRIRPDGTQLARVTSDIALNVEISGDWIYYITQNYDLGETYIRRTTKDGLITTTLATANVSVMDVYDGWIYYSAIDSESLTAKILRMSTNGEYNEVLVEDLFLSEDYSQIFAVYEDMIYYKDLSQGLMRCDLNGDNPSLLLANDVQCFAIQDDIIYYSDSYDGNALKKVSLDGLANPETITNQVSFGISLCKDKIIFASYDPVAMDFSTYCVGTDGSNLYRIE